MSCNIFWENEKKIVLIHLEYLQVTNQLHHLSIKRGIQVLRDNNFEPGCLKRRGAPGERDSQIVHSDVVFWTNHR